jgi:hypothetical protein
VAVIAELLGATWEALTLGELALGAGLLGGGAGSVVVARWLVRTLQASTRALEAVTSHLEASTAAARAGAKLAPLAAEGLRCYIRHRHGTMPVDDDSDELQVLRVAALGDADEIERLVEQLAHADEGSTLDRKLSRTEQRLVEVLRAARRQRQARVEGKRKRVITVVPTRAPES